MLVLDTDHLVELDRGSAQGAALQQKLEDAGDEVVTTIISAEEQCRGWLAQIHRQRNPHEQRWPLHHRGGGVESSQPAGNGEPCPIASSVNLPGFASDGDIWSPQSHLLALQCARSTPRGHRSSTALSRIAAPSLRLDRLTLQYLSLSRLRFWPLPTPYIAASSWRSKPGLPSIGKLV